MLRSVLTIMKGSGLAQLVGFLVLPLLSRSFSPEVFGHFQAYQAIMTMFVVIVMLRYEVAILRATDGPELTHLVSLCGMLIVVTSLVFCILLAGAVLAGWPEFLAQLGFGWWWLPLSGLIIGWTQIFSYLATRGASYGIIANSKVAQGVANAGTSAALAVSNPISSGLVLADVAGRLAFLYWLACSHLHLLRGIFGVRWRELITVAVRFRDLSQVSLPGAILNAGSGIMTPLLIYSSFTASTAGQFGLVERALALPVALVVGAVSQVHMGNLSADIRAKTGNARKSFRQLSGLMAGLAVGPVAICMIFSPTLFEFVFGPGWNLAADFARILAPAYFFMLISGGINMTLTIMGRQKTQLAWDVSRFAAVTMLWIFATNMEWRVEWIVAAYSLLTCGFSIALMILCYQALPRNADNPKVI